MTDKADHDRAKAMDFARAATTLYDKKYYEDAKKAIMNKNIDEFLKIAKKAGISSEYAKLLWDTLNSVNIGVNW